MSTSASVHPPPRKGKVIPFRRPPRRADVILAELTAVNSRIVDLDRRRRALDAEYLHALALEAARATPDDLLARLDGARRP